MKIQCPLEQCRWKRRKEARPEEILDAALDLFTEKGFSSTRMVDIAKKAGISKGTLYLYFDSKEIIFKELLTTMITPMVDEAELTIQQFEGCASELLRTMVKSWWSNIWHSKLSPIPKLIVSEAGNFPEMAEFYVDTIMKRARGLFESIIQNGIESGEFRNCDNRAAARLLMSPVIQANIWKHSLSKYDDPLDEQSYINLHLDIFLSGLTLSNEKDEQNAN